MKSLKKHQKYQEHRSILEADRRTILKGIGFFCMAGYLPSITYAQTVRALDLPLKLQTLTHHLGISVEDVLISARFYSQLVGGNNVNGEKEPFLRYFINYNPGEVAIGKLGTLGSVGQTVPLIDHFCVGAETYNEPEWHARLNIEGYSAGPSGVFFDHDNIPIQVAGAEEGGESLSAGEVTQMEPLYTGEPLVVSNGYDHVLLRVTDVDKTAAFYQKMFGFAVDERSNGVVWITDGQVRLGWREISEDETPGVESYAVRTKAIDETALSVSLESIGAKEVYGFDEAGKVFGFADPDGIKMSLVPIV